MTPCALRPANAQAVHFEIEPFRDVAHAELAACPLVAPGTCQNPLCSQPFAPRLSWQRYCSESCRRSDEAEMRRIGQKVAPALLAWRKGKDERRDERLRALSRAGRNYFSRLTTAWYLDRLARAAETET